MKSLVIIGGINRTNWRHKQSVQSAMLAEKGER